MNEKEIIQDEEFELIDGGESGSQKVICPVCGSDNVGRCKQIINGENRGYVYLCGQCWQKWPIR